MIRSKVVLPQPDGPSNATSSPDGKSKETLFRATKLPNVLLTFLTSILIMVLRLRALHLFRI